ncbi:hypothetical protein D3C72_1642370 [compost metagenome]
MGPFLLQAEDRQNHRHADHQGRAEQHCQQARDGDPHTEQVVGQDVAALDLVIGEVQPIEEGLHSPVGRHQRQGQGPDQGEGQLPSRAAR